MAAITDLADNAAAGRDHGRLPSRPNRSRRERASGRFVSRYEKRMTGAPGDSGFLLNAQGEGSSQGAADTAALTVLNAQRRLRLAGSPGRASGSFDSPSSKGYLWAVQHGLVSLTPLQLDLPSHEELARVAESVPMANTRSMSLPARPADGRPPGGAPRPSRARRWPVSRPAWRPRYCRGRSRGNRSDSALLAASLRSPGLRGLVPRRGASSAAPRSCDAASLEAARSPESRESRRPRPRRQSSALRPSASRRSP
jgi:hypothetical protein